MQHAERYGHLVNQGEYPQYKLNQDQYDQDVNPVFLRNRQFDFSSAMPDVKDYGNNDICQIAVNKLHPTFSFNKVAPHRGQFGIDSFVNDFSIGHQWPEIMNKSCPQPRDKSPVNNLK